MRFYVLSKTERDKIDELNKTQKETLLIVCDHDNGNIGVNADDLESPAFEVYFTALDNVLEPTRVHTIDLADLGRTLDDYQ